MRASEEITFTAIKQFNNILRIQHFNQSILKTRTPMHTFLSLANVFSNPSVK